MKTALSSFYNRPILGYIHNVDGVDEFYDHRIHEDEDGNLVYDESPIGIIPESGNVHLEYDEDSENYRVVVNGYIFEEYSKAAEILKREEECYVSVELSIRELQYNAKEKYLDIQDFFFSGVTILGKTPEGDTVNPGMKGSNIKLSDFKFKNSIEFNSNIKNWSEEISKKIEELSEKLNALSIENSKEGGTECVENENIVLENLDEETVEETVVTEVNEEVTEETTEVVVEEEETIEEVTTEENHDEYVEETVVEESPAEEELFQKTFSISHEDIRFALYQLLASYEEADNDYYFIESVYDDHFVYIGYCTGNIYGQKYTSENNMVSFVDERYNLHCEYLTDSEFIELNEMRKNYDSLVSFKNEVIKNEKISMLENYESISDTEEYKSLLENIDDYSKEELEEKADAIVGKYARQGAKFSFSSDDSNSKKLFSVPVATSSELKKPAYGGLFDDEK